MYVNSLSIKFATASIDDNLQMYTPINTKLTFTKEDSNYLDTIKEGPDRAFASALIMAVLDTNGTSSLITSGIGKQYIETSQFFHMVNIADYAKAENIPEAIAQITERALNWDALGRGKGGIAGAAVREALRIHIRPERECKIITTNFPTHTAVIKDFLLDLDANKFLFAFWKANAENVAGLAAAVMLKEGHHWDAANVRPQRALLAALDQKDVFSDTDLRKLFYLSIHPIPLEVLMRYVVDGQINPALNEAVRCRLRAPPAGTAGFMIAKVATSNIRQEQFFQFASDAFKNDLAQIDATADAILKDPLKYHTMSNLFSKAAKRNIAAVSPECLGLCIAYVKVCIKGSLASAPSLNKLADSHGRIVTRFSAALEDYVEKRGTDIALMISGGAHSYKAIDKAEARAEAIEDARNKAAILAAAVVPNI